MRTAIRILFLLAVTASVALPAAAETVVWTLENPPLHEDIAIDLEGSLENITAVQIQATGYGGAQYGYCDNMGGSEELELHFYVDYLLGGASGMFEAPLSAEYDHVQPLTGDFSDLEDGQSTLRIAYDDHYVFDYIGCYPTGYDPFTMTAIAVTITCDSALPTDRMSWSAIKSLYR